MKKIVYVTNERALLLILLNEENLKNIKYITSSLCKLNNRILKRLSFIELKEEKVKVLKLLLGIKNFLTLCRLSFNINDIVLSMDHGLNGLFFILLNKKYCLYEEGLTNYILPNLQWQRLLKKIQINIGVFGQNKNTQKIYLTGLAPIPKEIAHKVEIINLKKLWDKKSLEEQNEILDIFSFDLNIKEIIKGRDIILFTQPLSEDGVITEDEKVEIYSKIIKKYPQDRLIVKTHPREKTNYKEMFKDNLVLDNPFPFEILNLLDIKFNKAVTIFSTAALGLGEGVEVDFYGTEVNPKILARFGSCDNIMKRNSYLEEE